MMVTENSTAVLLSSVLGMK